MSAVVSGEMIPCTDTIHQLWDYLDGEVSPGLVEAIRRHLGACGDCRAVTEFEASFLRILRGYLDDPPPAPELRTKVLSALELHGYTHARE